jgi:phage/plasmid-like protein (TIGR03299 family)
MKRNTAGMKIGDAVQVMQSDLRVAPWRRAATWTNDSGAELSATEIIQRAGLDWDVVKAPLNASVLTESGVLTVEVPDKVANVRVNKDGTSGGALGITSPSYTIIQNTEIADIIDGVTYEAGAMYDSAGELKGGSQIYVAAKMPDTITVGGLDPVDTYIIGRNGHDGMHSLSFQIKHLRLSCLNGMAGWKNFSTVSLKHTSRMDVRVQQIRETLQIIYSEADGFTAFAEGLLSQRITDQKFFGLVQTMFPVDTDATDRSKASVERTRESVIGIYRGSTQENIHGTSWGAYQAFVEYADWARPVRNGKADAEFVRAERSMLGATENMKSRALELVLAR